MALTRIKRHMIADSAVMPNNIVSTATYTVGGVTSSGAITGTNFTANGSITASGNLTIDSQITASGGSGLKINNLRATTSSYALYFNNATNEITYGVANQGGGGTAYDQSLNTTDAVKFAAVTATTTLNVGTSVKFPDNTSQTTAWTGTVASSQITAVSTSKVTGLSVVGYTNNYNDLSNKPTSWSTSTIVGLSKVGWTNKYSDLTGTPTSWSTSTITGLSKVGWSNNYNDLDNKFDISTVTDQVLFTTSTVTHRGVALGNGFELYAANPYQTTIKTSTNGSILIFDPSYTGTVVSLYGDLIPQTHNKTTNPRNLGSAIRRWQNAWIETITVGKNTILFEDYDEITSSTISTSTLSIQTGTVYIDGNVVLDQSVAVGASPTFTVVSATTSTLDHIEVSTTLIANSSTVQIYDYTMPPAAATTSGWAMTSNGSGAIEFQPAVLSSNVSIDGGFATSVYTAFDYAIDGGGASA